MTTKIEWADETWNPITGCTPISPGCQNCYAERMAKRLAGRCGYPAVDPFSFSFHFERLNKPLAWRDPRRVFVCSMADLFHESVPAGAIMCVFDIMACATLACGKRHKHQEACWTGEPHTFLLLTKRPDRMLHWFNEEMPRVLESWSGDSPASIAMSAGRWPLPNVHIGVSVENQIRADERIPILLETPAAKRYISIEPMLGAIDISPYLPALKYRDHIQGTNCSEWRCAHCDWLTIGSTTPKHCANEKCRPTIDQVILGGETGPRARPLHPDWVRSVRDQCQAAGVPFFFKQWGEWISLAADGESCISTQKGWSGRFMIGGGRWDDDYNKGKKSYRSKTIVTTSNGRKYAKTYYRVGKKAAGAMLDGKKHEELI